MATHPWRAFTLIWNVLRGKETRKMETFLIELKRKGLMWFRSSRRKSAEPSKQPAVGS